MQQSPIICVNASKSIERWPWEGREGPTAHIFGREGGDYFSLWRRIVRHCENNTRISFWPLVHVSRAVTRAYRLFFHVPLSHEVNRSLSHNLRFRNSRFVKKYPFHVYRFKIYTGYIYIYWCRELCNEEKERVSGVFMENDPKRIFDIPSFSFMSCKIVFQIVIKNVRLSILVTKYI